MKKSTSLAAIMLFSSLMIAQCPQASYSNVIPLPPNTPVSVISDDSGTGVSAGGITLTPDPGDLPPQFTLGAPTANGTNAGVDFVSGASNWNQQNSGTGVTFSGSNIGPSMNAVVSTAWPKANVTYHDTSGNPHTTTVDFSALPASTVATTVPLLDYDANGHLLSTSAGFVTLINTNGTYNVGANTFSVWAPGGPNFDNALLQVGEHETGHQFLLGDQPANVAGDVMSLWGTTAANPTGAINNQDGHASSTITLCDDSEIKNNPNSPYAPPPPPPPPRQRPCLVDGNPCDPCDPECTPIIIDTEGMGFHLTSAAEGVVFDISGTGKPVRISWTDSRYENAFLALPGPDGLVHNGKELFGNFTPQPPSDHPNGFIALAQFDKPENGGNGNGVIDEGDVVYSKLRLWIDENHDGICQPDELHRLPELGVYSLAFDYAESRRIDQFGNQFRYKALVNPGERHDFRDERQHGKENEVGRWAYDIFLVTTH